MFQIQIAYHASINSIIYENDEAAHAAYDKISTALSGYRMFKNERSETVEVETDDGKCTFRLERMDAVTISKVDKLGPLDRIKLEREKMLREMRLEMGLPEAVRGTMQAPEVSGADVSAPSTGDSNG